MEPEWEAALKEGTTGDGFAVAAVILLVGSSAPNVFRVSRRGLPSNLPLGLISGMVGISKVVVLAMLEVRVG